MNDNDHQTDADWEYYGQHDPYYGVAVEERFRRPNLTGEGLQAFFASGEELIGSFFGMIRAHLDPAFAPRRALDFGCGVGRLVLPLARRCEAVVGVDVSEGMLREARANCLARAAHNVSFVRADDRLSGLTGTFDLVTSFIVFQHIPCGRGRQLFERLVELLGEGGVGALHITYSSAALGEFLGSSASIWSPQPLQPAPPDGFWHHLTGLRRAVRRRLARALQFSEPSNGHKGLEKEQSNETEPPMQMNPYLLNPLFHTLHEAGVRQIHALCTDHGGCLGLVLFFRKQAALRDQLTG